MMTECPYFEKRLVKIDKTGIPYCSNTNKRIYSPFMEQFKCDECWKCLYLTTQEIERLVREKSESK